MDTLTPSTPIKNNTSAIFPQYFSIPHSIGKRFIHTSLSVLHPRFPTLCRSTYSYSDLQLGISWVSPPKRSYRLILDYLHRAELDVWCLRQILLIDSQSQRWCQSHVLSRRYPYLFQRIELVCILQDVHLFWCFEIVYKSLFG